MEESGEEARAPTSSGCAQGKLSLDGAGGRRRASVLQPASPLAAAPLLPYPHHFSTPTLTHRKSDINPLKRYSPYAVDSSTLKNPQDSGKEGGCPRGDRALLPHPPEGSRGNPATSLQGLEKVPEKESIKILPFQHRLLPRETPEHLNRPQNKVQAPAFKSNH